MDTFLEITTTILTNTLTTIIKIIIQITVLLGNYKKLITLVCKISLYSPEKFAKISVSAALQHYYSINESNILPKMEVKSLLNIPK